MMNGFRRIGNYGLVCALGLLAHGSRGIAQTTPAAALAPPQHARDGAHDFDFLFGTWKFHLKRRLNPLTGSDKWVEFDGTDVDRKIWDGRANLDEVELDSPTGHIEGLTLRLYNPQSHQWRLYWANSRIGLLDPPQVGEFKNGRGEFFCQDTWNGRTIFIRYVWSDITPNSAHFEQSFSDDGGATWEVNWITDQTRVSAEPASGTANSAAAPASAEPNGSQDFEPLLGSWNYHLRRLQHPLTGSTAWTDLKGTGICYPVWNGRAELDTVELDGPTGHIEGLTLRLFDPASRQWSLYWANSRIGLLDPPQVGEFRNGRGEFYAYYSVNGKTILVRFDWSRTNTSAPHFEQSFSDDGGKTWEVNWITDQMHPAGEPRGD
jgi:hypothetical protein